MDELVELMFNSTSFLNRVGIRKALDAVPDGWAKMDGEWVKMRALNTGIGCGWPETDSLEDHAQRYVEDFS